MATANPFDFDEPIGVYGVKVVCVRCRKAWLGTLQRGAPNDSVWALWVTERVHPSVLDENDNEIVDRDAGRFTMCAPTEDDSDCYTARTLTCRRCRMPDGRRRSVRRTAKTLSKQVTNYDPYAGQIIYI